MISAVQGQKAAFLHKKPGLLTTFLSLPKAYPHPFGEKTGISPKHYILCLGNPGQTGPSSGKTMPANTIRCTRQFKRQALRHLFLPPAGQPRQNGIGPVSSIRISSIRISSIRISSTRISSTRISSTRISSTRISSTRTCITYRKDVTGCRHGEKTNQKVVKSKHTDNLNKSGQQASKLLRSG